MLTRRQVAAGAALFAPGLAAARGPAPVIAQPWGRLADGRSVNLYTMTSRHGLTARVTEFGAALVSLRAPDRHGRIGDIVLGFDDVQSYAAPDSPLFGAVVGRYANRIGHGRFSLDGKAYVLARNADGIHSMHGGPRGWHHRMWRARPLQHPQAPGVEFSLFSPDGDEGFPGAVEARFTYRLTEDNRLVMAAHATTTAPTVINMTNHSYFNLSGDPAHPVLDTELQVWGDAYTPADPTGLPTGEVRPVAGTPFDFRRAKAIGRDLPPRTGYNDNLVFAGPRGVVRRCARARDPQSGRTLELWTDQPAMHLYSAHYLDATGRSGAHYGAESAFCLEAQHFPDAPNKPQFPDTVLRPGQRFTWRAEYRMGVG